MVNNNFTIIRLTIIPADLNATPAQASQLSDAITNYSNLHPDANNTKDDDKDEYDSIIFGGSAEHESLDGFTAMLRQATRRSAHRV